MANWLKADLLGTFLGWNNHPTALLQFWVFWLLTWSEESAMQPSRMKLLARVWLFPNDVRKLLMLAVGSIWLWFKMWFIEVHSLSNMYFSMLTCSQLRNFWEHGDPRHCCQWSFGRYPVRGRRLTALSFRSDLQRVATVGHSDSNLFFCACCSKVVKHCFVLVALKVSCPRSLHKECKVAWMLFATLGAFLMWLPWSWERYPRY